MFYFKIALNNLKQSLGQFLPFILSCIVTFVLSNTTLLIQTSPVSEKMSGGGYALGLATVVLSVFALIMSIYSFNFLLKQRSRQFGLYNMLGMTKGKIALVSTIELGMVYLITVVMGSVLGAVFSNFLYLIFANIIQYDELNFSINPIAFLVSAALFVVIFMVLELINIIKVGRTAPLALFKNQRQGEREPRGNILLAFLGVAAVVWGYYLSLSSGNVSAVSGITRFFTAIMLVIPGTYLFFISFTTWYLKLRRKNKKYFYKPEHFINTSQMIFRMKQNAAGLANITLLATMAFVTIGSTVALYTGSNQLTEMQFPQENNVKIDFPNVVGTRADIQKVIEEQFIPSVQEVNSDFSKERIHTYFEGTFTIPFKKKGEITVDKAFMKTDPRLTGFDHIGLVRAMTQDDFREMGNSLKELKEGEVAFYDYNRFEPTAFQTINWFGTKLTNVEQLQDIQGITTISTITNAGILVVADEATLNDMVAVYNQSARYPTSLSGNTYMQLTEKEQEAAVIQAGTLGTDTVYGSVSTEETFHKEGLEVTGGFLFVGFLLGVAFLLGAALIIYYKQLSEGTEDKRSYKILQEVGMSFADVKKSINSQILFVFFMPLVVAILHYMVALPLLKKLLLLFGVQGDVLIYGVSAITVAIIVVIYFIIYKVTSRTYYKLIER